MKGHGLKSARKEMWGRAQEGSGFKLPVVLTQWSQRGQCWLLLATVSGIMYTVLPTRSAYPSVGIQTFMGARSHLQDWLLAWLTFDPCPSRDQDSTWLKAPTKITLLAYPSWPKAPKQRLILSFTYIVFNVSTFVTNVVNSSRLKMWPESVVTHTG